MASEFLAFNENADGNRGTPWTKKSVGFETDGVRERDGFVGDGLVVFVCFFLGSEKQSLDVSIHSLKTVGR